MAKEITITFTREELIVGARLIDVCNEHFPQYLQEKKLTKHIASLVEKLDKALYSK